MPKMKCPNCGSTNERTDTHCLRCGAELVEHVTAADQETVSVGKQAVPDWRKEVTRKAREFGERKKFLTTPPRPLKEHASDSQSEESTVAPVQFREIEKHAPAFIEPPHEIQHPKEELSVHTPPQIQDPVIPVMIQPQPSHQRFELDQQGMLQIQSESEPDAPLHLGRRAASLIVDHAILGIAIYVVVFIFREFFSYDIQSLIQSSPFALFSALLLFHFTYYFYFLKTARQTPGQVFFSLEVRKPLSAGKIFSRWLSLVFLNVLNVLPLFFGKKFLLMDRLSDTEVRSMKPED